MACFIYGCTKVDNLNIENQTSNLHSSVSGYDEISNQSLEDIILKQWHICNNSIQYRDINSCKEIFVDPNIEGLKQSNEYLVKISMLKIQNEEGKTLLHIIAEKGYHKFLKFILGYLYACSPKEIKDTKRDIKEILNTKNKESFTVLHTATINDHKDCIDVLFDYKYISKDDAEDAIRIAIEFAKHPANGAVEVLQKIINQFEEKWDTNFLTAVENSDLGRLTDLLFKAIYCNNINVIKNIEIQNNLGNNILHILAQKGENSLKLLDEILYKLTNASLFLDGFDAQKCVDRMLNQKNIEGMTPIDIVVIRAYKKFLEMLSSQKYTIPYCIAQRAIECAGKDEQSKDLVKFLRQNFMNLHNAMEHKDLKYVKWISSYCCITDQMIKILQEQNKRGDTPLHILASGWKEVFDKLCQAFKKV